MSSDTQPAMTYPTAAQYSRWKTNADAFDMSVSEYIQAMVEAGAKKFDATVEPDETRRALRAQRNDLKDELAHARTRIARLEDQLHHGERQTVREYIDAHPGASFDAIVQHVIDTVPARVNQHLDDLDGDAITVSDDAYYPIADEETTDDDTATSEVPVPTEGTKSERQAEDE